MSTFVFLNPQLQAPKVLKGSHSKVKGENPFNKIIKFDKKTQKKQLDGENKMLVFLACDLFPNC